MKILQGLWVGPGSATERWPSRKIAWKWPFFWGKNKLPKKDIFFLHISSSYAKILGETNFHAREIPLSGWKVEGVEERKKEKKEEEEKNRWKQWPASLRPPPRVPHASTSGPKFPHPLQLLRDNEACAIAKRKISVSNKHPVLFFFAKFSSTGN